MSETSGKKRLHIIKAATAGTVDAIEIAEHSRNYNIHLRAAACHVTDLSGAAACLCKNRRFGTGFPRKDSTWTC